MIKVLFFIGAFWAFAQDSLSDAKFKRIQQLVVENETVNVVQEEVSVWSMLLQLVLGLSVVLVLLYVALKLLRHLQMKSSGAQSVSDFHVLQSFHLSPSQKIQKVMIYEKIYLLGHE